MLCFAIQVPWLRSAGNCLRQTVNATEVKDVSATLLTAPSWSCQCQS